MVAGLPGDVDTNPTRSAPLWLEARPSAAACRTSFLRRLFTLKAADSCRRVFDASRRFDPSWPVALGRKRSVQELNVDLLTGHFASSPFLIALTEISYPQQTAAKARSRTIFPNSQCFPPEAAAAAAAACWSERVLALCTAPAASFHRVNFTLQRFASFRRPLKNELKLDEKKEKTNQPGSERLAPNVV